jgi:iron complex outermembrane recepter protein
MRLEKMSRLRWIPAMALLAASTAFGQAQLSAADQDTAARENALEEIQVTATRRETNLQQTAVADTAFSTAQLDTFDVQNTRDLSGLVPSLYMGKVATSPTTQTYGMRGLAQTDTLADPTVGVYLDDVYIPRSFGAMFDVPGVQQIEVLRGPQGTLYGRNSVAGAIKYITLDPDNHFHAEATAEVGNYGQFEAKGLVSGPLVADKLYADLAFIHEQRSGYTYDATTGRWLNNLDTDSVRAKLRVTPTDALDIKLTVDGLYDHSDTTVYVPSSSTSGHPLNPYVTYQGSYYQGPGSLNGPLDLIHEGGVALDAKYTIDDHLVFKSISAIRELHGPYDNENGGLPAEAIASFDVIDQHADSQEFQLLGNYDSVFGSSDALNFASGVYFFHEGYEISLLNLLLFPTADTEGQADLHTNSYAGYVQADYWLTHRLSFTVGARYTSEIRSIDEANFKATALGALTHENYAASASHGYDSLNPKFSLQFQATPDLLAYASYSQGFQAGGYSLRAAASSVAQRPYGPEKVTAYEAGLKADWLTDRLRTNLALFYNNVDGFQATALIPGGTTSTIVNAGNAYTEGVEAEISATPWRGLLVTANTSYLRAHYTSFAGYTGVGDPTDIPLPFAPTWIGAVTADYKLPLDIPGEVHIATDMRFQSLTWLAVNYTPQTTSPSQQVVDLHLNYQTQDKHWKGGFSMTNVLDHAYRQYEWYIPAFKAYSASYNPPRMFYFTLSYQY